MADDPLLDFFDLSKKFERIKLIGTQTQGRVKYDENAFVPPPMMEEDAVDEKEGREYWHKYKEKEEQDLLHMVMQERSGGGAGARSGVEGSFMSGLDANTWGGSVLGRNRSAAAAQDPEAAVDLMQKYNFRTYRSNEKLHILEDKEKIIDVISNNQVTIISGHTGCGKTTQIPQFILEHRAAKKSFVNIIVTQPRRIAAQSVAKRVCDERGWQLGRLVGYKVGLDKANCSSDTRLLYCTTGVLKKMIISKKSLAEWTHVILDEVHEREEDMDFLLLLCKKLINTNSRGVKLILMSATICVNEFQNYFSWPSPGHDGVTLQAASYEVVEKRTHAVKKFYSSDEGLKKYYQPDTPPDFYEGPKLYDQNVTLCKTIILQFDTMESKEINRGSRGTVLVFLPGEAEILTVKRTLTSDDSDPNLARTRGWKILMLHSRIPLEDTQLVFKQPLKGERKIILSTNMAESSITIPDVEYVIDFCLTKYLVADPETNYVSLKLQWADKQSMLQREGRCGRVKSGRAFILITEDFHKSCIPEQHEPEMKRAPLDKIILDTKLLDFGSPKELLALAMDPPDLNNIYKTVMHLKEIGALLTTVNNVTSKEDGDLTLLGELIAGLPVDVRMGKLIIFGHLFDVLDECVIIAAGLSNKSIFATPMEKKLPAYANKLVWADCTFSDCLAVLVAYTSYQKYKRQGHFERAAPRGEKRSLEHEWCHARFLQMKCLRDVEITKEEITLGLKRKGIQKFPTPNRPPLTWPEKCRNIQFCIFGAFYPNYFIRRHGGVDMKEVQKAVNGRDPMSSVYLTGFPQDQARIGSLYSENIKLLFKECSEPERIEVEYDGSKVIVQFARSKNETTVHPDQVGRDVKLLNETTNLTGEIIHQVYVAMKLKQMPRNFVALNVYKTELAEKKFAEMEEGNEANPLPTDDADKKVWLQLRGPHHPLEFKIAAAHRIGSTKEVRIEQDSVNSVLLDRYPTDNHDQWMVAGHVGMNPSGNSLMLRSTTFLPNEYGLGAMLIMIFAPFVEMRCDPRRKRYTGFLAGLGVRDRDWGLAARTGNVSGKPPSPKVSYFGEHDMEVQFDVGIDNEDISLVNKIRYYINYALSGDSFAKGDGSRLPLEAQRRERVLRISTAASLVEIQANIQKNLALLFGKARETVEKQAFHRENYWLEMPKDEYLLFTNVSDTDKHVFKMITGINFRISATTRELNEKTLKILQRLNDMARKQFTEVDERCPVCPGVEHLRTSAEILQHITGRRHHQMVEAL